MTPSRKTVRKAIATLIKSQSTMAQNVFWYLPSDFAGTSPVICITGAGTERIKITRQGLKVQYRLAVETFVLYADPTASPPWTEENAEDLLDDLEADVATIVANNPSSNDWISLAYETASAVSKVTIGGVAYLYEVIPLIAEVL